MSQFRHLFVIDALDSLNLKMDTSLRLAWQLHETGRHEVFVATLSDLFWDSNDKMAGAWCQILTFKGGVETAATTGERRSLLFSAFHCIHMRKDPPFNMHYLSSTWLLDSAPASCLVVNHPRALQALNEKLASFLFPEHCIPSFVSADPNSLQSHILKLNTGVIVKPLDLYGGRGIERISSTLRGTALEAKLIELTAQGTQARIVQPFRSQVMDGEIRAFYAFGEAISWCLKKPKSGSFLANTGAGASLHHHHPSPSLQKKIDHVSQALVQKGVNLVGYDIIGEEISEINLTSPRLLFADAEQEQVSFAKLLRAFERALGASTNS